MLEVNGNNILGWLTLIKEVYPLDKDEYEKLSKFLALAKYKKVNIVKRIYQEEE